MVLELYICHLVPTELSGSLKKGDLWKTYRQITSVAIIPFQSGDVERDKCSSHLRSGEADRPFVAVYDGTLGVVYIQKCSGLLCNAKYV